MERTRRDVLIGLGGIGIGSALSQFKYKNETNTNNEDIKPKFEVGPGLSEKIDVDVKSMVLTNKGVIRTTFDIEPKRSLNIDDYVTFNVGFEYVKEGVNLSDVETDSQVETNVIENDAKLVAVDGTKKSVTNTGTVQVNFNAMRDVKRLEYHTRPHNAQALVSVYIAEKGIL